MINREEYKKEMSALGLSNEQKNLLKVKMYQADETQGEQTRRRGTRIKPIRIAAGALALALVAGGAYIGASVGGNIKQAGKKSKKPFIITANAAEVRKKYADAKIGDDAIAVYSGSAGMGWLFDGYSKDGAYYKDGYVDYFISYDMDAFRISADNISSVTLSTNKKGLYFTVTPYADTDWDVYDEEAKKEEEKEKTEKAKYIFGDLTHSQYTRDELVKYNNGLGREFFADSVTYKNTDHSKQVKMDNAVALMIESDHGNEEIAGYLNELQELEKQSISLRDAAINGTDDGKKQSVDRRIELIGERIIKIMLEKAEINVEVKYTDGTTESRALSVDTVNFRGASEPLLKLGLLSFNNATGEYE